MDVMEWFAAVRRDPGEEDDDQRGFDDVVDPLSEWRRRTREDAARGGDCALAAMED